MISSSPIQFRQLADKSAISLSLLCAIHCVAVPLIVALVPTLSLWGLEGEAFHLSLLFAVIPLSLFALTLGCKKHRRYSVIAWGFTGLFLMIFAVTFGHHFIGEHFGEHIGEASEKWLTVIGAFLVAYGHWLNHRLCRQKDCTCDSVDKAS